MSATITATYNAAPLATLERLIATRQRELGESASAASVAAAITVLRSLRADTKVVNPRRAIKEVISVTDVTGSLVASFTRRGRGAARCVRHGGPKGYRVSVRTVNLMGAYHRGESPRVFRVSNKASSTRFYYIIAASIEPAREYAERNRLVRMRQYGGMARFTLSAAMGKIGGSFPVSPAGNSARAIGLRNLVTNVAANPTGGASVTIVDALDYAAFALRSGAGAVDRAIAKAANSITAYLNHALSKSKGFETPLKIPFPELKGK